MTDQRTRTEQLAQYLGSVCAQLAAADPHLIVLHGPDRGIIVVRWHTRTSVTPIRVRCYVHYDTQKLRLYHPGGRFVPRTVQQFERAMSALINYRRAVR